MTGTRTNKGNVIQLKSEVNEVSDVQDYKALNDDPVLPPKEAAIYMGSSVLVQAGELTSLADRGITELDITLGNIKADDRWVAPMNDNVPPLASLKWAA